MTTRADYKKVAIDRLRDAQVLLSRRRYGGAYYLAGYAAECAIKVCLAEGFKRHTVPTRRQVDAVFNHDLAELLSSAKLKASLEAHCAANAAFARNWDVVRGWHVESRYEPAQTAAEARGMFRAVSDTSDGVLAWIRSYW